MGGGAPELSPNGSVLRLPGIPDSPLLADAADSIFEGFEEAEDFGRSIQSGSGMYDGGPMIVVSAPTNDFIRYSAGAVYLLDASRSGPESSVATVYGVAMLTVLGWDLSPLADLDGDGVDDLLLTADCDAISACGAWVFRGPLHGSYTVDDAELTFRDLSEDNVGNTLTAIHDLRGDGAPSLVLTSNRGAEAEWYVLPPTLTGEHTPASVATARLTLPNASYSGATTSGDVNGDGAGDLIASHQFSRDENLGTEGGGIYLLYSPLSATGTAALPDIADASWLGIELNSYVGSSVATGDANNDGFDDLFFSGKNPEDAEYGEESAWFFYGQGI